ncbi:MAG TPA: ATP-binding protein [Terriglobales bacterium]|nr:ATP-binding protein [Terriglobales bacterium]
METVATPPPIANAQLADAFSSFIAAAGRLEHSHWQLHDEVTHLRTQLEERNRALASSLTENERMRIALRHILDALPCGVAVLEPVSDEIVLLNPEARRLLQIPMDESAAWADLPERIRTVLHTGSCSSWAQGDEHDFCFDRDDKKRWVSVRYSTMAENGSGIEPEPGNSRVILICRDTTASKEAEQEREASRHMVALAEMATVLAHEIRNPLGSMELLAGLLAGDAGLNEDSKQCVQHLQAGVRSLSAVVNNVLRFHSSGTSTLQPTKLAEALRSAANFVQPLARQNGIALSLQLTLGTAEIAADAGGLQQVILNLVCNALRHTSTGGNITVAGHIELRDNQRNAVVEVTDTGEGIRPEDIPHIFEAGFSTSKQSPGLGLTVCQRIVEQHCGTITTQTELGKGTTFRMEFPVL